MAQEAETEELVVVGHRTERNDVEDYWMEKVTALEGQYDQHLHFLQTRLFDHNVDRKLVTRLREDNRYLKHELDVVRGQKKALDMSLKDEGEKHKAARRQVGTVKARLATTLQTKDELTRTLNQTNKKVRDSEKRELALGQKLTAMKKDKTDIQQDMEGLRSRFIQKQADVQEAEQQRKRFTYALNEIDTERRVQTKSNVRLLDKVQELVEVNMTKEERLYQMQTEINRVMRELAAERENGAVLRRQHRLTETKLQETQDEAESAKVTAEQQDRATKHWREEYEFAKIAKERNGKGGRNESTQLSGQMAALKLQIHRIEQKIGDFEAERSRLARQLEILPSLQKCLEQMTRTNKQKRLQLMSPTAVPDEILDLDPFLYYAKLKEKHAAERAASRPRIHVSTKGKALANAPPGQLPYPHLSYEKEISKLQSQIQNLDSQVRAAQRKENRMRVEMEQKKSLQQELFWREKAMLAIEKDRVRMNKVAIKCAQEIGDRLGRGLPFDLLLGADTPTGNYEHLQNRLQGQIQTQQERIEMLRRKSSLPKIANLEKELKGLQMGQLLGMDDNQLQRSIEALTSETGELERRSEIVKRIRPLRRSSVAPVVEAVREEAREVNDEELLATISKHFREKTLSKKLGSSSGSSNTESVTSSSSSPGGDPAAPGNLEATQSGPVELLLKEDKTPQQQQEAELERRDSTPGPSSRQRSRAQSVASASRRSSHVSSTPSAGETEEGNQGHQLTRQSTAMSLNVPANEDNQDFDAIEGKVEVEK